MKRLAARALHRVIRRDNLVYRYAGALPEEPVLPSGLKWDVATQELLDYVMTDDKPRRTALKRFLSTGAHGIIIHDGRRWAAHGFISPPRVGLPRHLPRSMTLERWWFFYMHTRPEWRRQGLQKACSILKIRLIHTLSGELDRIMTDTEVDNIPSRKTFLKTGFQPTGVVRTLELGLPKVGTHLLYARWNQDEVHRRIDNEL